MSKWWFVSTSAHEPGKLLAFMNEDQRVPGGFPMADKTTGAQDGTEAAGTQEGTQTNNTNENDTHEVVEKISQEENSTEEFSKEKTSDEKTSHEDYDEKHQESELKRARTEAARYRTERNKIRESYTEKVEELTSQVEELKTELKNKTQEFLRNAISTETGVPAELITLGEEEAMRTQAKSLRDFAESQKGQTFGSPFVQSVGKNNSGETYNKESFAKALFGL